MFSVFEEIIVNHGCPLCVHCMSTVCPLSVHCTSTVCPSFVHRVLCDVNMLFRNVADDDADDDTDEPSRSRMATKMALTVLVKICGFELARLVREWHLTPFPGLLTEEILHHFKV